MTKRPERPQMLPVAVPHYNGEHSTIPDSMRVSFSDGSTAVYDLRVEQPRPVLVKSIHPDVERVYRSVRRRRKRA